MIDMKILRQFWERLAEERYAARAMVIITTFLTLYTVLFTEISPVGAWAAGLLNGALWLMEMFGDDD